MHIKRPQREGCTYKYRNSFIHIAGKGIKESPMEQTSFVPGIPCRESPPPLPGRSEYHSDALANADESFARLRSDMFADVVDAVVGFVERNGKEAAAANGLIPACALLTGVNLPDHEDVFEILAEEMMSFESKGGTDHP